MTLYLAIGLAGLAFIAAAVLGRVAWRSRRETRKAMAARDAAVQQHRSFQNQAPFGLLNFDDTGIVINTRLARLLDLDEVHPETLQGLADLFESADFEILAAAVGSWREGGAPPQCTLAMAAGERWLEAVGFGDWEDDGVPALAFWDISDLLVRGRNAEHRAEGAAAERARLGQLLDDLPLPIWARDSELKIVWCNAAFARTVAREVGEVIANGDVEIEPAIMAGHAQALARTARERGAASSEVRHVVVNGQRRAFNVAELPGEGGAYGIGYALDITAQEAIETEFKRFVDANTDVMNNLNAAIAVFGPDRHLAFFNEAYARLWQLDEAWLATRPAHSELLETIRDKRLLPEEADYPAFKQKALAMYNDLLETTEEYRFLPDGRTLRRLASPHPMGGLLFVYEDVTDRMMLERSYNTLNAVQRETLANLHEAVAVFGSDARLKLHNPGFAEFWGLDNELLASEPHVAEIFDAVIAGDDNLAYLASRREDIIAQTTERRAGNGRMELPNGAVIDYASVPLPDGNMLYTYLNVTDTVRIERALRERAEALETADQLKTEFVANVSYELRSPLNVIIGFTEILANEYFGNLNDQQRDYCRGILESSQQLLEIINNILDLASIEAGRLELDIGTFDVAALLNALIELIGENARAHGVALHLDCPANIGQIKGDERRVKQVLFNLLNNAIKFSDDDGQVTLGAQRNNDDVTLWVQDQGVGIDEQDRARVFDRFQRGSKSGFGHGAGLGLAMVKSFVQLHGGQIKLDSEPEVGTKVTVVLPTEPVVATTV